jgi:predicted transposase YbfD/YdcC
VKQKTQTPEAEGKNSTKTGVPAYSNEAILFDVGSVCEHLSRLTDGRKARGKRYTLTTILVVMLMAKLSGEDRPEAIAEWAQHRAEGLATMLGLKRARMPHATTYGRVLRKAINPEQFEREMNAYFKQQPAVKTARHICMDGKQICGTQWVEGEGNVYLLGAYVPEAGVMLMQIELAAGEGELTVAPRLLRVLDLQGKIVTGDAAFTQRNLSIQIVEAGGEYVWKVKDNQSKLLDDIEHLFEPQPQPALGFNTPKTDFRQSTETRCGHGRVETRTLTTSSLLKSYSDWPGLEQVFKLTCHTLYKKSGKSLNTLTFGITSLHSDEASPASLLNIVRTHWAIEGASHQRRDVTFHEDHCDLRLGHAAHIIAILNNLVVALIARCPFKNAPVARRSFNAHPQHALQLLISCTP